MKRYGLLYLFWFIVLLPATLYIRRYSQYGFPQILWVLVRQFLFGSTFQVSWYIMACIIGIPLIHFLSRKMNTGGLLFLTIPLYLFATACSKYRPAILASPVLSDPYRAMVSVIGNPFGNFIISLIYITLGKLMAQREGSEPSLKHSGAGLVLCTAGLIGEFLLAQAQSFFDRTCDCWFLLAPTAMFLVLFFLRLPLDCRHSAFLRKFNTITFCSHMAVLLVLRKVFSVFQLPDPLGLILFFATTVTCLVMTLIILRLEKRKPLRFLRFSY